MPRSTNAHARFIPQRLAAWLAEAGPPGQFAGPLRRFTNLAAVTAVPVGHYSDGLNSIPPARPSTRAGPTYTPNSPTPARPGAKTRSPAGWSVW